MSTIDFEQSILTVTIDSAAIDRNWGLSAIKAHFKAQMWLQFSIFTASITERFNRFTGSRFAI